MRHRLIVLAVVCATALGLAAWAGASSGFHFTSGGSPVCTDQGTQLECTAEIAGLGNGDVVANLNANGTATGLTCTTPSGSNQAPGQNPAVPVSSSGSQQITNIKNGRASVDVFTATPTVSAKDAGCPNGHWIVTVNDVAFSTYILTISQGTLTLFTCTGSFPSPSTNGETSIPTCS